MVSVIAGLGHPHPRIKSDNAELNACFFRDPFGKAAEIQQSRAGCHAKFHNRQLVNTEPNGLVSGPKESKSIMLSDA
jgi:hypothetical protein